MIRKEIIKFYYIFSFLNMLKIELKILIFKIQLKENKIPFYYKNHVLINHFLYHKTKVKIYILVLYN